MIGPAPAPERTARELSLEHAEGNRNLSVTLGGICISLLTFSLFFLYGGVSANGYNSTLFEVALGAIVLAMFLFVFASGAYFSVMALAARDPEAAYRFDRRAYMFVVGGLVILTLEPALILFTVKLWAPGTLAAVLWVISLVGLWQSAEVWRALEWD